MPGGLEGPAPGAPSHLGQPGEERHPGLHPHELRQNLPERGAVGVSSCCVGPREGSVVCVKPLASCESQVRLPLCSRFSPQKDLCSHYENVAGSLFKHQIAQKTAHVRLRLRAHGRPSQRDGDASVWGPSPASSRGCEVCGSALRCRHAAGLCHVPVLSVLHNWCHALWRHVGVLRPGAPSPASTGGHSTSRAPERRGAGPPLGPGWKTKPMRWPGALGTHTVPISPGCSQHHRGTCRQANARPTHPPSLSGGELWRVSTHRAARSTPSCR